MTYEWETKKAIYFQRAIQDADGCVPIGFEVIGIIVANQDLVEGAVILDDQPNDMFRIDVLKDALGDLMETYSNGVREVFRDES